MLYILYGIDDTGKARLRNYKLNKAGDTYTWTGLKNFIAPIKQKNACYKKTRMYWVRVLIIFMPDS